MGSDLSISELADLGTTRLDLFFLIYISFPLSDTGPSSSFDVADEEVCSFPESSSRLNPFTLEHYDRIQSAPPAGV